MDMQLVKDQTFKNEAVLVDGKHFQNCTFENVTLVFGGEAPPTLTACRFRGVSLQFEGAASRTLLFLSGLREGGFAQAVESVFQSIRNPNF